jgi:hypothetical protein
MATARELSREAYRQVDDFTARWTGGVVSAAMVSVGLGIARSGGSPLSTLRAARSANVMATTRNIPTSQLHSLNLEYMMAIDPKSTAEILAADEVVRKATEAAIAETVLPHVVDVDMPAFPEATGDTVPDTIKGLGSEPSAEMELPQVIF